MRVLLVEDEPGLVLTLTDRLVSEGYEVQSTAEIEEASELAQEEKFDVLILDVMLPGGSGLDLCRDLRGRGNQTPILFLTARGELADKVVGLKLGGDDYLTKPFEMLELLARLEALTRRSVRVSDNSAERVSFGDVKVDFRKAEVRRGDELIELSALEFKLLRYFLDHRDAVLSRDELLNKVWGYEQMPHSRTVDVHVSGLRQKIETSPSHPEHIVTVHGMGYKFVT